MNFQEIKEKFTRGEEVELNYQYVDEKDHQDIYCLLLLILGYLDQMYLVEVTFTIMKELIVNANKANAKREYFKKIGKDISNHDQYRLGMKHFQKEIIAHWSEQKSILTGSDYYILIKLKEEKDHLTITVDNNVPLLEEELKRITKRMESAKKFNDLSDAFSSMSDNEESAGLGIVLTQLLLKNSGIGTEKLKIGSNGKITRAIFEIPKYIVPIELTSKLKDKILKEVEGLPPLPHTLTRLITLCNNPDSDFKMISDEIEHNPALTADLLKLSNSSGFANRNKVATILQAVKVVGLKNLKNMLYVSGVRKILDDRYSKLQDVWDHSNKCSYFARIIATDNQLLKLADAATVGGLLHDLGKLVLLSVNPALYKKITSYQQERDLSNTTVLEEIAVGLSHPTLGAQLARKWEFPEELVQVIEFHHRPFMVEEGDSRDLIEIVYLANMIIDVSENKANYFTIDQNILNKFNLKSKDDFEKFQNKLEVLYGAYSKENA